MRVFFQLQIPVHSNSFAIHRTRITKSKFMMPKKQFLMGLLTLQTTALLVIAPKSPAQDKSGTPTSDAAQPRLVDLGHKSVLAFDEVADKALLAMKKRAEELNIKGVALVAYAEGDTVKSWTSKMVVVGNLTSGRGPNQKGNNLLGIAYSKAAEMADTLKDSGSKVRPAMTGEYGWQGGLVTKGVTGILIVAFSGGPSEDDLKVSHAGLDIMSSKL
jgi:hypothetical protein